MTKVSREIPSKNKEILLEKEKICRNGNLRLHVLSSNCKTESLH